MFRYGTLVQVSYDKPYYGIIIPLDELTADEKCELRDQITDLKPTFSVKFTDNLETTVDIVGIDQLTEISIGEVANLKDDISFKPYQIMIDNGEFVKIVDQKEAVSESAPNVVYVHEQYFNKFYQAPQDAISSGNMIPPSIITSTRYYSSEFHLSQLLKQGHSAFALEQ